MNETSREYWDVVQAAAALGITTTSLYKLVNHANPDKRLEPVNRSTHRGDGGYRFRVEEVEKLKAYYVKPDLTPAEAAQRLGRSTTFIHKLLQENKLDYYEGEYRGKRTYFIRETELERYRLENPDAGKYETIYDGKHGLFLYQPFARNGQLARLIELKRVSNKKAEAMLLTEDGERISYEEAVASGWRAQLELEPRKPNTAYGYARFIFPLPRSLDSIIYTLIEEMFKQIGPANMRIVAGGQLEVEVRKSVLKGILPATHGEWIDKLRLFIRQGEIVVKYDGILIDTGLSPITMYIPEVKKQMLTRLASQQQLSLQEWLERRLDELLEN